MADLVWCGRRPSTWAWPRRSPPVPSTFYGKLFADVFAIVHWRGRLLQVFFEIMNSARLAAMNPAPRSVAGGLRRSACRCSAPLRGYRRSGMTGRRDPGRSCSNLEAARGLPAWSACECARPGGRPSRRIMRRPLLADVEAGKLGPPKERSECRRPRSKRSRQCGGRRPTASSADRLVRAGSPLRAGNLRARPRQRWPSPLRSSWPKINREHTTLLTHEAVEFLTQNLKRARRDFRLAHACTARERLDGSSAASCRGSA